MTLEKLDLSAFEFTYELAHKMIKRYLRLAHPSPDVIQDISFPDLIRTACEYNLLRSDLSAWKEYRKQRGTTSHTYDPTQAEAVFKKIPEFLAEAKYLLTALRVCQRITFTSSIPSGGHL